MVAVRPVLSDGLSACPVCDDGELWPNRWMDWDATWYGGVGPGHIVLDRDPAFPRKGAHQPPLFGPLCSGTVAYLSNC